MIRKICFLLSFLTLILSTKIVKLNASSVINLPSQYVQVGIGNDDLLNESNLTLVSGYVNWHIEGDYFVTYNDRLMNVYKKKFIIISNKDNQYFLTSEEEQSISFDAVKEVIDVFYINDSSYYVVSNYQIVDPTYYDQEKICVTFYENNQYKWEYRYYKYSRFNYGWLHNENLIITGLVYNESNNYINSIVLFEITKDRQIIKTREILSNTSCYCYGMYLYNDYLYLVTNTNGNGLDYSNYKEDYENRLVIFLIDYETFKIVDGVVETSINDFYIIDSSFYGSRIGVNIAFKTYSNINGAVMTYCIYEYNDRLEYVNKYYYNTKSKDYLGFQLTIKDVCYYSINYSENKYCVNICYLNYGVDYKNIYFELENNSNINDVEIIAVNRNDIYFCLKNHMDSDYKFIGFAKINSSKGIEYFPQTVENIQVLNSKINNNYIVNTYLKDDKIYFKNFNLIEVTSENTINNNIESLEKSVKVNTRDAEKYDYIDNTRVGLYGNYYNINYLKDSFGRKYYLLETTKIELQINIKPEEVYQRGYKLIFNGVGILNGEEINSGFIINDIGKYLLEIKGENAEKKLFSFVVSDLTMSSEPRDSVFLNIEKLEISSSNIKDENSSYTTCEFNVKANYSEVIPIIISIFSLGVLSLILLRKKI